MNFDWSSIELINTPHFKERMEKRNITMKEIIQLFKRPKLIYRRKSFPNIRYLVIGDAFGKILEIVLEHKTNNIFWLITIFEATENHKKLYRSKVN